MYTRGLSFNLYSFEHQMLLCLGYFIFGVLPNYSLNEKQQFLCYNSTLPYASAVKNCPYIALISYGKVNLIFSYQPINTCTICIVCTNTKYRQLLKYFIQASIRKKKLSIRMSLFQMFVRPPQTDSQTWLLVLFQVSSQN